MFSEKIWRCRTSRPGGAARRARDATCSTISTPPPCRARSPDNCRASPASSRFCRRLCRQSKKHSCARPSSSAASNMSGRRSCNSPPHRPGWMASLCRGRSCCVSTRRRPPMAGMSCRADSAASRRSPTRVPSPWARACNRPTSGCCHRSRSAQVTLLPAADDVRIQRILGNIPSRAADNLFWYGRYLERAEATLRVVRCLCTRSLDTDLSAGDVSKTIAKLAHQLVAWGAVQPEDEGRIDACHCAQRAARRDRLWLRTRGRAAGAARGLGHPRAYFGRSLEVAAAPRRAIVRAPMNSAAKPMCSKPWNGRCRRLRRLPVSLRKT